jgi:hypothetical protein
VTVQNNKWRNQAIIALKVIKMIRKNYREELMSLFTDLNCLKANPKDLELCFSIQEKLIDRIRSIEYRIRVAKKEIAVLRDSIKNDRLSREQVQKLRYIIKRRDLRKFSYDQLLLVFRDIGDSIAFIYLDKWDIKPLCMSKEPAGFISGKRGLRQELLRFRSYQRENKPAIFNDITNSLRHGDITVPTHGVPIIIEVKSGKSSRNNKRAQRQFNRINKISQYLVSNNGEAIYPELEGVAMQRRDLGKKERDHQKKLSSLMKEAISSGRNIMRKIEDGLYYHIAVTDFSTIEEDMKKLPADAKWVCHIVNSEKQVKQAYYPFTLSINEPEALFQFYDGNIWITIFIDINIIEREFSAKGFIVKFLQDDINFLDLDSPDANLRHAKISLHFFGRVFAEFLSLRWMLEEICNQTLATDMKL